jgi:exonuclease III
MSFTVASYNVLATAYIRAEYYPHISPIILDPVSRLPTIVEHLVRLDCDCFCLQEVDRDFYRLIGDRLMGLGYGGEWCPKGANKPDGCAIFSRFPILKPIRWIRFEYPDAHEEQPLSGHIAQMLVVEVENRCLGIANTHIKWDPPKTPLTKRYGYRQMKLLLSEGKSLAPECEGWIICGDFNVTSDNEIIGELRRLEFEFSHVDYPDSATCNSDQRAKMIDFIFHDRSLRSHPMPLPIVTDTTKLPSFDQPSDHVAVIARMEWT